MTPQARLQRELHLATLRLRNMGGKVETNAQPGDEADGVIAIEAVEMGFATRDMLYARISSLRCALARIADGTYGTCEECEEPISPARLRVLPEAPLCVRCQDRAERNGERREVAAVFDAYARKVGDDQYTCVYSRKTVE